MYTNKACTNKQNMYKWLQSTQSTLNSLPPSSHCHFLATLSQHSQATATLLYVTTLASAVLALLLAFGKPLHKTWLSIPYFL
jgi:hypothetical protein